MSNPRNRAVMEVKVDNLTRRVGHNGLVERAYALEQDVAVVKAEIVSADTSTIATFPVEAGQLLPHRLHQDAECNHGRRVLAAHVALPLRLERDSLVHHLLC